MKRNAIGCGLCEIFCPDFAIEIKKGVEV